MNRRVYLVLALAALAAAVPAHFVWGVHRNGGVRFEFSENPGDSILENFAGKAGKLKLVYPEKQPALVTQDHFVFQSGNVPLTGARLDYGVLDRGEQGRGVFQLIYHVKSAKTLAAAGQSAKMPIEIMVSRHSSSEVKAKVLWNGKPLADAEVIYGCQKAKEFTTKTDAKGESILSGILPNKTLFVRSFASEQKSGEFEGKKFDLIRHYATLTAPTGSEFKSLTGS